MPCYIVANQDNIRIITVDKPRTTYKLSYNKIIEFRFIEGMQYYMYGSTSYIDLNDGILAIRYRSKEILMDILFDIPTTGDIDNFECNKIALKNNNIYSYVNNIIPLRDDQNIDL